MENDRAARLEQILSSDAAHKLIISGPGTGKTHTFGQVLLSDPGESLVVTLINNLVDDMQAELGELADVRTFHSLARMLLHGHPYGGISADFHFYPALPDIVSTDSLTLQQAGHLAQGFSSFEFASAFRLLAEDDGRVDLFVGRANYYDAVGFDDSVYRLLSLFRDNAIVVPKYHHVMVDEYQDFSQLEVAVISALESENRTLIVGDDDQAIYDFRQASPAHLRQKANDGDYTRFALPYCTRCTEAVVSATHSIVERAQQIGALQDRLDKEFVCYLPDKQRDNERYPSIQLVECTVHRKNTPYIPKYIESIVSNIDAEELKLADEGGYPLALVVGPGHYLDQIHEYLVERFERVAFKPRSQLGISVLDGFKLIRERQSSNLGWRVLVELLDASSLGDAIVGTRDNRTQVIGQLDDDFVRKQLARLDAINRAITNVDNVSSEELADLESVLGQPIGASIDFLLDRAKLQVDEPAQENDAEKALQPSILLTNFNGCKGLSAGFTFITGLERGTFPRQQQAPTDTEICQLIVAVTRTRKQCHLMHARNFAGNWTEPSIFFGWIPGEISEHVEVSKDYF